MHRATVALMLLLAGFAAAQQPATELLRPQDKPRGVPVRTPRPQAKVDEKALPLLEQIARAYGQLQALELAGTLSLTIDDGTAPATRDADFTSLYLAPMRFKHEASNQPILGCDGKKVYGYSNRSNAYALTDAPTSKPMLRDLPRAHNEVLPVQNLALVLAISRDPAGELKEMATQILVGDQQQLDGKAYAALLLTLHDRNNLTLLIDPQTNLIRRAVFDTRPLLAESGRTDIKSATYTIDYTVVNAGVKADENQFAWSVPEGAREIGSLPTRVSTSASTDTPAVALVGRPAPEFALPGIDGKVVSSADFKGRVVVLDFWASWCGPCIFALPQIEKLHQDFGPQGVKVYAINQRETRDVVQDFLATKGLTLPVLLDEDGGVGEKYMVEGIPQTVVIGKDGLIKRVYVGVGPASEDVLRGVIEEELKP
jgi:thiol-disulfide isomerase/thioredoxin